jgi:hypothetical protein
MYDNSSEHGRKFMLIFSEQKGQKNNKKIITLPVIYKLPFIAADSRLSSLFQIQLIFPGSHIH